MVRQEKGKFCSRKCVWQWSSKNRSGINSPGWKRQLRQCKECGNNFYALISQNKIGSGKFCSRKCKGKGQIKRLIGNRYGWKGGLTPASTLIRSSDKYKNWRSQVFIRDNFTCQKCGDSTGGNLEAHHKRGFRILMREAHEYMPLFSLYAACMIYAPLWDINNGKTLCKKCHDETRGSIYARRKYNDR